MTSLSFLQNEKQNMFYDIESAFMRRRQMHPFPLAPGDIVDVQHPPGIANLIRQLIEVSPNSLYWNESTRFVIPCGDSVISVKFRCKTKVPITESSGIASIANTEAAEVFRSWACRAHQEQEVISAALELIVKTLNAATTHQQLHRYMPEIYGLYLNHLSSKGGHRLERLKEVVSSLNKLGSKRASKIVLDGVSLEERRDLKTLIASTLMLPGNTGLGSDSPFEFTWVETKK